MSKRTKELNAKVSDAFVYFVEPRNLRESRTWYRHFYFTNEVVRESIDTKVACLLQRMRLVYPPNFSDYEVKSFFVSMCKRIKLKKFLINISTEYYIMGNAFIYAKECETDNTNNEKYRGWDRLILLPPDSVLVEKIPLTDDVTINYKLNSDLKERVSALETFGHSKTENSETLLLNTDPSKGSFVYQLANKGQYDTLGTSIIESCMNTLILRDRLRKKQNTNLENLRDLVIADRSLEKSIQYHLSSGICVDETLKSYIESYVNDYLFRTASEKANLESNKVLPIFAL